jgi:hypothetical protein
MQESISRQRLSTVIADGMGRSIRGLLEDKISTVAANPNRLPSWP